MPNRFALGKKAISECDLCGFQYPLKRLKMLIVKARPTNMLACPSCWVKDHPQLMLGMYPVDDPQALRNPRRDNSYEESGLNAGGNPSGGSRDIQWGWNPVGLFNPLGLPSLPDKLLMACKTGNVTVEAS
jgi:hypothetical protein